MKESKKNPKPRLPKRRIRQDKVGNWQGYEGNRWSTNFAGSEKEQRIAATLWRDRKEAPPEPPPVKQVTPRWKLRKEMSATIEPCYCGEEDHRQVEIYELDDPDRVTAKFTEVTFHLSQEDAESMAKKINRARLKSLATKKKQEGEETMKKAKATKKSTKPGELSNKARVYQEFKKGITDRAKLLKLVKNQVKETTIRSWLASWKRKDNLPAIAKA